MVINYPSGGQERIVFRGKNSASVPDDMMQAIVFLQTMAHECRKDAQVYHSTLQRVAQNAAAQEIRNSKSKLSEAKFNEVANKFDTSMVGGRLIIGEAMKKKLNDKQTDLNQKGQQAANNKVKIVDLLRRNGVEVIRVAYDMEYPFDR